MGSKCLEILIESVNYIIINYALSNMAMLFRSNPLFILFILHLKYGHSGIIGKRVSKITGNKAVSIILLIVCFFIHIGIIYWVGPISGNVVPFRE